jgi:hypothetical protein
VFEEFFATGLRMSPHSALTEILIKFWVQLHQLTLKAFAQLSKYFWAVMSFGGEPNSDGFVKRYKLHYHLKKVIVDDFKRFQQFGILNFLARQGDGERLTPAIKNKWSTDGRRCGSTARYPCMFSHREGNPCMPRGRT